MDLEKEEAAEIINQNQSVNLKKSKFTRSDGYLNLLCWLTIYPNRFIATFFRQLCLCGCGVSKTLNDNGVQTVYCCPETYNENRYDVDSWNMDRTADGYWICYDPPFVTMECCMSNSCGHCLDHVHYVSKYNNKLLSCGSCFLWLFTLILIKTPGTIIYIIGGIIFYIVAAILIYTFLVVFVILTVILTVILSIIITMVVTPIFAIILIATCLSGFTCGR